MRSALRLPPPGRIIPNGPCSGGSPEIFFLWRPVLRDPDHDLILERPVQAQCGHTVTHDVSDVYGGERFGIEAVTPRAVLEELP